MADERFTLWLAGSSALLIDNALTLQQRQDALDCVLYAQLLASKRAGEAAANAGHWFEQFRQGLSDLGWVGVMNHAEQSTVDEQSPTPLQCMEQWLLERDASLEGSLPGVAGALGLPSAHKHLTRFARSAAGIASELAVVSSAQVMALCSAVVDSGPVSQERRMAFRGWVGSPVEQLLALKRSDLRELLESKHERDYFTYLGKLGAGGMHGRS
ncbi:hypothetical protein [Pseudomonas sp.]|uniref:hypothetical protein n=1 Tax=Pseudomonas sp. TaxID=306 RepID=UPI0028A7A8C7|nr:hypothetical protein [Pseudomonas sp.]